MWALIISFVFDQSCKSILAGVVRHQYRWM